MQCKEETGCSMIYTHADSIVSVLMIMLERGSVRSYTLRDASTIMCGTSPSQGSQLSLSVSPPSPVSISAVMAASYIV